jgi:hypothetical protein
MRAHRLVAPAALALLTVSFGAGAATITVVNNDGPGEGFNDPTVVAPLPSNPATTLGAQRLAVFQAAANQWGALLNSTVEIKVRAAFNPLTCSGTSAVLGSAGAISVHRDFVNAPVVGTWYSAALANALSGTDLGGTAVGQEEINSQFNVDLDNGTCLNGVAGWYYSTADTDPTPSNRIPLLPVVFHELAHGLGFQTFTSSSSGAFFNGFPDIWTNFLFDLTLNQRWRDMTQTQRQTSAIGDPNLVWNGPNVNADHPTFLSPAPALIINAPAAIAGTTLAQPATFGPAVPPSGVTGNVVEAFDAADGTGPTTTDACTAITNPATVAGNIALVDRGSCNFTVKVANCQTAGAIAVIVANNQAGLPPMGGTDPTIVIPSYGVPQTLGTSIRGQLAIPAVVNATLGYASQLSGTNGGRVRMHAPNPVQTGSSVSHWTTDTFPNLLMEPSLNTSIFDEVDLTIALFRDIGWDDNAPPGNFIFADGLENP